MAEGNGEREETAMLLGKRPRPPMRRTTSMTFSAEDLAAAAEGAEAIRRHHKFHHQEWRRAAAADLPPRSLQSRSFSDFGAMETTAQFLMACGLCNRRLGPGFDTYMYRGEISFCSLECRQHRINQDELKRKGLLTSKKIDATSTSTASETSGTGQTAVAV